VRTLRARKAGAKVQLFCELSKLFLVFFAFWTQKCIIFKDTSYKTNIYTNNIYFGKIYENIWLYAKKFVILQRNSE